MGSNTLMDGRHWRVLGRVVGYAVRVFAAFLLIFIIWFAYKVWHVGEGVWRPHAVEDLAELHGFTRTALPPQTRLIAARQQWTPGENNVWAVLEMPEATAREWLSGPLFETPPTSEPEAAESDWILRSVPEYDKPWDPWHPETADQILFNSSRRFVVLADMDQPGTARLYIYWILSSRNALLDQCQTPTLWEAGRAEVPAHQQSHPWSVDA